MEKNQPVKIEYTSEEINKPEDKKFGDIFGMFRVSSTAPTGKPVKASDQIVIYTNSTTYRLYWYDQNANVWHYISATV
jgi:hypothetical protein